ncbi:hypothetical protein D3C85_1511150 [compost metagenome]
MFQGIDTDQVVKDKVSVVVSNKLPFEVSILNYRKNGTPYTSNIQGFPVFNRKQELVNFITFAKES